MDHDRSSAEHRHGRFGAILDRGRQRLLPLLFAMFVSLGVAIAFVLPPFQAPDETTHWVMANVRADPWLGEDPKRCSAIESVYDHFGYDDVRFRPQAKMPRGRFEALEEVAKTCKEPQWFPYGSAFTYPGVLLARLLTPGEDHSVVELMRVFYAGRLLQGVMVALVLLRLLVLSRRNKRGLTVGTLTITAFCLAPLFMHQAFAISSDPICFAWALCLVSWLLNWRRITWFDVGLYAVVGLIVAGTKPVFLPLAPAALLLGLVVFEWRAGQTVRAMLRRALERRRWLRSKTAWALALLLLIPIPGLLSMDNYKQTGRYEMREGVSPEHNKQLLRDQPGVVFGMMTRSISTNLKPTLQLGPLGWLDTPLSTRTERSFLGIFLMAALLDLLVLGRRTWRRLKSSAGRPVRSAVVARLLAAVAFGGGLALSAYGAALAMFLYSTPKGATEMMGLQARYLTPTILVAMAGLFVLLHGAEQDEQDEQDEQASGAPPATERWFERLAPAVPVVCVLVAGCLYGASLFLDVAQRFL